jgi:hypothetical protein
MSRGVFGKLLRGGSFWTWGLPAALISLHLMAFPGLAFASNCPGKLRAKNHVTMNPPSANDDVYYFNDIPSDDDLFFLT